MSKFGIQYWHMEVAKALPQGEFVPNFMLDLEKAIINALGKQPPLVLGKWRSDGASSFVATSNNRSIIELGLEIVTLEEVDAITLSLLGSLMKVAYHDLLRTPKYVKGKYDRLTISTVVTVHRGIED